VKGIQQLYLNESAATPIHQSLIIVKKKTKKVFVSIQAILLVLY